MSAGLDFDLDDDEFGDDYYSDDGYDMNDLDHFYNQIQNKPISYGVSLTTQPNLIESGIESCHHFTFHVLKIAFTPIFIAFLIHQFWR